MTLSIMIIGVLLIDAGILARCVVLMYRCSKDTIGRLSRISKMLTTYPTCSL
jgi:hypothetical protein